MKTRMRQEAASAELVMLNSRAVLASSTAPFRSLSSFLSRTCSHSEGGTGQPEARTQRPAARRGQQRARLRGASPPARTRAPAGASPRTVHAPRSPGELCRGTGDRRDGSPGESERELRRVGSLWLRLASKPATVPTTRKVTATVSNKVSNAAEMHLQAEGVTAKTETVTRGDSRVACGKHVAPRCACAPSHRVASPTLTLVRQRGRDVAPGGASTKVASKCATHQTH